MTSNDETMVDAREEEHKDDDMEDDEDEDSDSDSDSSNESDDNDDSDDGDDGSISEEDKAKMAALSREELIKTVECSYKVRAANSKRERGRRRKMQKRINELAAIVKSQQQTTAAGWTAEMLETMKAMFVAMGQRSGTNPPALPTFAGKNGEFLEDWLKLIRGPINTDPSIADDQKGLRAARYLKEEAAGYFYRTHQDTTQMTMAEFEAYMTAGPFSRLDSNTNMLMTLLTMTQDTKTGETVQAFITRFEKQASKIDLLKLAMDDNNAFVHLLLSVLLNNGLQQRYKVVMDPTTRRDYETYDACKTAVLERNTMLATVDASKAGPSRAGGNGSSSGASGSGASGSGSGKGGSKGFRGGKGNGGGNGGGSGRQTPGFQSPARRDRHYWSNAEAAWLTANNRCFRCVQDKAHHTAMNVPFGSKCTFDKATRMPNAYQSR